MGEGFLRNRTFDDLQVGDAASLVRIVGRDDIDLFAAVSGDTNPAHLDATFAATDLFGHIVTHGMRTAALVSAVLGTKLPGPGAIHLGQDLRFRKPVAPGDTITATVTVEEKRAYYAVVLETNCANQKGDQVLWNNDHDTGSKRYHLLRHAAQQQTCKLSAASSPNDDSID